MFFVQITEAETLIISNAVKAELITESEGVIFKNYNDETVAFYRLAEIKGFYNGSDAAATITRQTNSWGIFN